LRFSVFKSGRCYLPIRDYGKQKRRKRNQNGSNGRPSLGNQA